MGALEERKREGGQPHARVHSGVITAVGAPLRLVPSWTEARGIHSHWHQLFTAPGVHVCQLSSVSSRCISSSSCSSREPRVETKGCAVQLRQGVARLQQKSQLVAGALTRAKRWAQSVWGEGMKDGWLSSNYLKDLIWGSGVQASYLQTVMSILLMYFSCLIALARVSRNNNVEP